MLVVSSWPHDKDQLHNDQQTSSLSRIKVQWTMPHIRPRPEWSDQGELKYSAEYSTPVRETIQNLAGLEIILIGVKE